MKPCYFLGTSLHTCLGDTCNQHIAALGQPPGSPGFIEPQIPCPTETIPYHRLLDGVNPGELKWREVLHRTIQRALDESGLDEEQVRQLGLFVGSSSFDIADEEARLARALAEDTGDSAIVLTNPGMSRVAEQIRQTFALQGPDFSFNTACTSSANALLYAASLVDAGVIDHALVVGMEFANETTTYGFEGLQLLSRQTMRPFAPERDGLVLGEACAAVVVGRDLLPGKTTALIGGANRCDTFSMSLTREDGGVVSGVMTEALDHAGINPQQLSCVKTHGTATPGGDQAEENGMRRLFRSPVLCSALKPYVGHTLGACGLAELILFCQGLDAGFAAGLTGTMQPGTEGLALHPARQPLSTGHFLLNYFGFGGNNTSLVLRH